MSDGHALGQGALGEALARPLLAHFVSSARLLSQHVRHFIRFYGIVLCFSERFYFFIFEKIEHLIQCVRILSVIKKMQSIENCSVISHSHDSRDSRYSVISYSSYSSYFISRVPPGLTTDAVTEALLNHFNMNHGIHVQFIPANTIFRYGGVQHAALVHFTAEHHAHHAPQEEIRVVYDLEAQAHFTLQTQRQIAAETQLQSRINQWRWALRGIVIQ